MEAGTRQGSGVAGVVTAERARPSDRWPGARGRSRLVTAVSWPERLLTHARRAARAQALALGRAGRPPGFTVRVAVDTVLSFSVPQCSYLLMGTGILGAAARFERVQPPRAEAGARGTAAGPAEVRKRPLIMFSVLGRAVRPVVPVPPFLSSLRTLHPHTEKVPDPNQIFLLENSRTPSDGTRSPPGRPAVVRATSPRAPLPPSAPSLLFQPYDRLSASEPAEPSSALGCSRSHPLGGEPCHGVLLLLNVSLSWGWDRGNLPVTRRPPRRI